MTKTLQYFTIRFTILLLSLFLLPHTSFAATNLSPILTNEFDPPNGVTSPQFLIMKGDRTSAVEGNTCIANGEGFTNAGGFGTTTIHLTNWFFPSGSENGGLMTTIPEPAGIYTIFTGTGYYGFCFGSVNFFSTLEAYGTFYWTGSSVDPNFSPANVPTRITLVSPYDGAPVASTTIFDLEASGYVNPFDGLLTDVDEHTGIRVRWNIYSNAQAASNCIDVICAFDSANTGKIYYSGTGYLYFGSQYFNVSTSTGISLPEDYYTLTTSIIKPISYLGFTSFLGFDFGYNTLVSTTTHFVVGSTTPYQDFIAGIVGKIGTSGLGGLSATSTEAALSSCNMISLHFNIGDCIGVLLYPDKDKIASTFNIAKQGFFSRAPWGYATRLIGILSNSAGGVATSTLPSFTIAFATSSPLYGDTLTFDMGDMVTGGATLVSGITDPISGKSMRDIVEPWIQLFIAISALLVIFNDIMGMSTNSIKGNTKHV